MKIKSIEIEAELWDPSDWSPADENTSVWVTLDDNSTWVASLYSYRNISSLTEKNRQTGECLSGKYFWGTDMILVDEISRSRIEEVIKHLVNNKPEEFKMIFSKCH